MKKTLKNIIIREPLESYPSKFNPIIQTTIINTPKIISSENHVKIIQYINDREPEQTFNEKLKTTRNIITENKTDKINEKKFKSKIYHKRGINNHNLNKNESAMLNKTTEITERKKDFINNSIANKYNKTKYNIKNNNDNTEIEKPKSKVGIESYNYLRPKKKIQTIGENKENKYINLSNDIIEKNNNKNNYKIDKEKSKTFERINDRKYKKNVNNYNEIYNNEKNKNQKYNTKTIKLNGSEMSLYIKKSPFQKQIIQNNVQNKDYSENSNLYSKLYYDKKNMSLQKKDIINEDNKQLAFTTFKKNDKITNLLESIKEINNSKTCKKIVLLDKKKDKEELDNSLLLASANRQMKNIGEHLSSPFLDKVLKNFPDYNMMSRAYSLSTFKNVKKNNSLPKTSLRFLINKASKDKQFGESFYKAYKNKKDCSVGKSLEKIRNKNRVVEYENNTKKDEKKENIINEEKNNENFICDLYKNKKNKKININKIYKEKENKNRLIMNNLEILKRENYNNKLKESTSKINENKIQDNNNANDSNKFIKTSINFKPSNKVNNYLSMTKNKSNDNIFVDNNNINKFEGDKNEINNHFVIISSLEKNNNSILIDIELLYNLENKILDLYVKIKKYQKFEEESFDIINYYFKNDISKFIIQLFNSAYYKNIIISYIKTELLSYFLCYDVCFYNCFEQIILLIKSIITFIHTNFLLLLKFIIIKYENNTINFVNNKKNRSILLYLKNIIKQNINIEINNYEINEQNIIKIIMKNTKEIINYYKLILENTYQIDYLSLNNNEIDKDIKFPYCFKLFNNNAKTLENFSRKKSFIISSFFVESYQLINNYSLVDLENFFYSFLDRNNIKIYKRNSQIILPKIDNNKYKYTLVLDLDETLVHCNKKSNNGFILLLRPGLIEFLKKMKNLCELILFSFGTSTYVDSVVKVIEKNEKFFEYILDRNHGIYENGNCIKDLNMLNRDLKNIIIIDDTYKYFQLHKENGICVKPFYGDIENDKNTLVVLGNILQKIFRDANITGDIRISLKKYKKILSISNIIN